MGMIGVWLVGAQGSLASTVVVGARAIARGLAEGTGLVTELPELRALSLVGMDTLVFGGWDIAPRGLVARAENMTAEDRALPPGLVERLRDDLEAVEARVRPGYLEGSGPATRAFAKRAFVKRRESLAAGVDRLGRDLDQFRTEHRLDTVIVVNLASTEPPIPLGRDHERLEAFRRLIQDDRRASVTPSMLYA